MSRYNEDLDYLNKDVDITDGELEEIIREADSILAGHNADEDQKITALLKKAQALQKLNKYDESREYVERILKLKPEMPEALVRRGIIYSKNEEYAKAVEDLSRAIELKPDYARFCEDLRRTIKLKLYIARFFEDLRRTIELDSDYARAVEYYSRAIELRPDDAAAYHKRGDAYNGMGEYGKAVEDLSRAIELQPDFAEAYYKRGLAYARMEEYGKAVKDYSRAIGLQPDDAAAYNMRGLAYNCMGEYGKAVEDFSRAIELQPDFAEAYYNRSVLFCREKKYDKAFRDELTYLAYILRSQDRLAVADAQWVVSFIIKNSKNLDFIWKHSEEALKKVPHFFPWIIGSFIKGGFTGKKYKDLVNAVFELWKRCYGTDSGKDGRAVILYQYTTMPALRAMFETQRLRLSPVSYLNDPNEGKTFFTYLKENTKTKALKPYLEKIQEKETGNRDIIFIRSFTGNKDNLVMWDSSYADNGRGAAIGVPASLLNKGRGTPEPFGSWGLLVDKGKETPEPGLTINADAAAPEAGEQGGQPVPLKLLGLFKVRYEKDGVGEIAGCLEAFDESDFKNDALADLVARLFVPVAALIKSEEYRHENEYRLVCIASWEDEVFKKYVKQTAGDGVYIETEKVLFERFAKFKDNYPDKEYVEVYMGPKVDKITRLKWRDCFRYKYPDAKGVEQSKIEWQ
jgi:tetratricopeptide (TPR) repeat protein